MNVYEIVTEKIVKQLQAGVIPWRKPWKGLEVPKNYISGKAYRGINVWLLLCENRVNPFWLTFKQASGLGARVKKGEKGSLVVFWKLLNVEKVDSESGERSKKVVPLLRYYVVFNADQIEGLPAKAYGEKVDFKPIAECEKLVDGYKDKPEIKHGENQAFYSPKLDYVNLPQKSQFDSEAEYYSTLFHELAHSTGHEKRLSRKDFAAGLFGSASYSKEELVAEFAASFLCGLAGIEVSTLNNSSAYIKNWLDKLSGDKYLLVQAAGQAQKAVDYIRGIKQGEAVDSEAVAVA